MYDAEQIAQKADVIIEGYAMLKCDQGVVVINLNQEGHATVFSDKEEVIETSMDDIELEIAKEYLHQSWKYLEEDNA